MANLLLDRLLGTDDPGRHFTAAAQLAAMLRVEAALARAEAAAGVIPATAVPAIETACHGELYSQDALALAAVPAGNLAIPLVRALTAAVKRRDAAAAGWVHWGATSQDILDTGLVLQLKGWLGDLEAELAGLAKALALQARRGRDQAMVGRTWLVQALPVTFGLKAAGWLDAVGRARDRLGELKPRLLALQFGGAAGTLASLGDKGPAVAAALARDLDLALPDLPWHAARDRLAELGCWLGLLLGTLAKLARDLALMGQTEVGEALEGAEPGRGGSSTMPHKRNPVRAAAILGAATRAPGLVATLLTAMSAEQERGLGGWQAEWATLPELCRLSEGALRQARLLVEGLELHPERMAANLALTQGLILAEAVTLALGRSLGRLEAHHLVEAASKRALAADRPLAEALAADPQVAALLPPAEIQRLLTPDNYLGAAGAFVDRALAAHEQRER